MMVAPVTAPGATSVRVYFPRDAANATRAWRSVFDPQRTEYAATGAWVDNVPAPLGQPAVFVRVGAATGERFEAELRARGVIA